MCGLRAPHLPGIYRGVSVEVRVLSKEYFVLVRRLSRHCARRRHQWSRKGQGDCACTVYCRARIFETRSCSPSTADGSRPLVVVVPRRRRWRSDADCRLIQLSDGSTTSDATSRLQLVSALSIRIWLPAEVLSETRSTSRSHHALRMATLAFVDVPLDHDTSQ